MNKIGMKALYDRETAIRPPEVLAEALRGRQMELDALFLDHGELREELVTRRKSCPVCGATTLHERAKLKGWPMAACAACGVEMVHALPTSAAWTRFYSTSHSDSTIHRKVYEGTKAKRVLTIDEPRVRWINERCPDKGAILDVGCSSGTFIEVLQASGGWECHGIEPNPEAVKAAHEKGLDMVVCSQLEDYVPPTRFDAITFFSTFHQLDNPLQSLQRMRSALKPHGRAFAAELNFAGFYAAFVGDGNPNLAPPIIKTFLTSATVVTLFEAAGFRDVEVTTPGQLDLVRLWMYWQNGGTNGRSNALERLIAHEFETDSTQLQGLIVDSKASEHMWITAKCS